jgi:hypothetical protein
LRSELLSNVGEKTADFIQRFKVSVGEFSFVMLPHFLGGIEFGGIGRQEKQGDILRKGQSLSLVESSVVEDNDFEFIGVMLGKEF